MNHTTSTIVELANMVARYRSALRGYKRTVVEQAKIIQEQFAELRHYEEESHWHWQRINRMRAVMPAKLRRQFDEVVGVRNAQ